MRPDENDPLLGFLRSLRGETIHYFSNVGNAGDGFIAHATYHLFGAYGITAIPHSGHDEVNGETVLIAGGGNLVEGRYGHVADIIGRLAGTNDVILLPHTITGNAEILAETHRRLKVFCREPVSFELALMNGANGDQLFLAHDMVFYLNDDHLGAPSGAGQGILHALRTDGESTHSHDIPADNIDLSMSWNGDFWHSPALAASSTNSMAAMIDQYETVQTDRLHVAILSGFLGKTVYMLPNAYFKNRAIYEHSLRARFSNVRFVNTLTVIDEPINEDYRSCVARLELELGSLRTKLETERQRYAHAEKSLDMQLGFRQGDQLAAQRANDAALAALQQADAERERNQEAERHVEALTLELAQLSRTMSELLESRSWKLTDPLRKASGGLRRRGGAG